MTRNDKLWVELSLKRTMAIDWSHELVCMLATDRDNQALKAELDQMYAIIKACQVLMAHCRPDSDNRNDWTTAD
jgi:hypothetical protein